MDDALNTGNEPTREQMLEQLRASFREEAYELLVEMEAALLELERAPGDREQLNRAFRAMHTIKGSGGVCEFREVVSFTHDLETLFDRVRKERIMLTPEIVRLALIARDHLKAMLDAIYGGASIDLAASAELTACMRQLADGLQLPAAGRTGDPSASEAATGAANIYRIRIRPRREFRFSGTNLPALLHRLALLGECRIMAHCDTVPELREIDPSACSVYWDALLTTSHPAQDIRDVFTPVRPHCDVLVRMVDDIEADAADTDYKRLGEILVERGDVSRGELDRVLEAQKRVGELLVEQGAASPGHIRSALAEQQQVRSAREQREQSAGSSSIRVATAKLDSLVDLVGELVTVQARLSQMALVRDDLELLSVSEEVERLTASLRENTMSARMLPIGTTFGRFRRLVHDLAAGLGKEVDLVTAGAETELDKTIIERLGDPIVHIIRNALDHGIERPEAREAAGKARRGTVRMAAAHSGAHVVISVSDDGAGMDSRAIREQALGKGLIRPDQELTERELRELVMEPGFSTAAAITDVSGRGVGMDVVKRAIEILRGSITIDSQRNAGTTITLTLPLTLAIIDGFLTRISGAHFVFPLALVEECVELSHSDGAGPDRRNLLRIRGSIVPYIRLRDFFAIEGSSPEYEQVVITNVENRRIGFVVDMVVGEHQTVIKPLGSAYRQDEGISGATILGDGAVALILDIPRLVKAVERVEAAVP